MSLIPPHRPASIRAINAMGRGLSRMGLELPSLRPEVMIEKARRQTGHDDFGGETWRAGFDCLLEALGGEAELNQLGRVVAQNAVHGYLVDRLQLTAYRREHPELAEEKIHRPLFIVGLPRTGTTILFNLLAENPRFRKPLSWEVERPCPPPEAATYESDPRIAEAVAQFENLDKMSPHLKHIHEMQAQLPQECASIIGHEFISVQFNTIFNVPSYQSWLHEQSYADAYRFHRQFLSHLQSRHRLDRWVLKSPAHLPALEELFAEYPDACVIQTHRDPTRVMASIASLSYTFRSMSSDRLDPLRLGRQQLATWARYMNEAREARARLSSRSDQLFDVQFAELMADPVALVAKIYDHFDIELTDETRARMERHIQENPRAKHGRHRYTLDDFGLDEAEVAESFELYREQFAIPKES